MLAALAVVAACSFLLVQLPLHELAAQQPAGWLLTLCFHPPSPARRQSPFGAYSDLRTLKKWVCCKVRSLLTAGACSDMPTTTTC